MLGEIIQHRVIRIAAILRHEVVHAAQRILAPDAIGPQPPTDGGFYHQEGVPIVNFLAAPFYLFDEMDTLDKVDRASLVPLTRAAIRLVDFTRGRSAAAMRGEMLPGTPPGR